MAAATLLSLSTLPNPNPNFRRYGTKPSVTVVSLPSAAPLHSFFSWRGRVDLGRRISPVVPFAASREERNNSDIEVENEETDESQQAWKQTLDSFKEEAKKMKEVSQEAYEVYSKKALIILKETSEALKIRAEKARHDMSIVAKEISKEGQVYLSSAAKNSPDSVKDIVETFASIDELKEVSAVRDYYLGIPYGAFLAVGGFLYFMLTGSISAIRFGVVLGTALLALSISSLRSWKSGNSTEIFLKGQVAIATVIFVREWRLFCQKRLFSSSLMTLISGAVLVFYVYRMMIDGNSIGPGPGSDGNNKGPSSDGNNEGPSSENSKN
ncbi:protein FATTY ACID EXPORT 3, chloroplastic [Iris pallida]|uniref:Protein FATTY ACID EXPORT 3, chloroplastic n=1 Tax=Iris pallida TaxID=29817 RepID=A0AAX6HLZ4_IRIPA|nr:protein FATTY ACID EXPORT 3, chloroplastic [Iris pallida]